MTYCTQGSHLCTPIYSEWCPLWTASHHQQTTKRGRNSGSPQTTKSSVGLPTLRQWWSDGLP